MSTSSPLIAVQNMPAEYLEKFNASRPYVVNITDTEYCLSRTYGNYNLPAKEAGERYSVTEIAPRRGTMDMGDRKVFDFPITPQDVATDLCREINVDAGYDSFLGVFVSKGAIPTEAELAGAEKKLTKFYGWCVAEGDKIWQQSRMVMLIPDLLKRAADYLNLDREWKTNVQPNLECPGCGTHHKPGLALCIACGLILDDAKARRLYPDRFAPPAPAQLDPPPSDVQFAGAHKGKKKP